MAEGKRQTKNQPATQCVAGWWMTDGRARQVDAFARPRMPRHAADVAVPAVLQQRVFSKRKAVWFMSGVTFSGPETRNPAPLPVRGSDRSLADFRLRASSSRTCGFGNKDEYEERGAAERHADGRSLHGIEVGGVELHGAEINMRAARLSIPQCVFAGETAGRSCRDSTVALETTCRASPWRRRSGRNAQRPEAARMRAGCAPGLAEPVLRTQRMAAARALHEMDSLVDYLHGAPLRQGRMMGCGCFSRLW